MLVEQRVERGTADLSERGYLHLRDTGLDSERGEPCDLGGVLGGFGAGPGSTPAVGSEGAFQGGFGHGHDCSLLDTSCILIYMPAMTVVEFIDADGDKFPIALPGHVEPEVAQRIGRERFDALVASGDWRPTEPVTLAGVKLP